MIRMVNNVFEQHGQSIPFIGGATGLISGFVTGRLDLRQ